MTVASAPVVEAKRRIEREGKIEEKFMLKAARDGDSFILICLGFGRSARRRLPTPTRKAVRAAKPTLP